MLKFLYIALCILACCFTACNKEEINRPYSDLNVRFLGEEEDIRMASISGKWNFDSHIATLSATSDKFESFYLFLPQLLNTGSYSNITIDNISLSDGVDFFPGRLTGGSITITYLDPVTVRGEFRISLEDEFNGAENRTISGGFGIYQ